MSSPPSDELTDLFSFTSTHQSSELLSSPIDFPFHLAPPELRALFREDFHIRRTSLSWAWKDDIGDYPEVGGPIVCIGTCAASHMCLWMCDTILLLNSPFSSQLIEKLKMTTRPVKSLYLRYIRDWLSVSFLSSSYCDQIVVSIRSNFLRSCTL